MAPGRRFIPNLIVFLLSFQCYYSSSTIEGRKLGRRFTVRINEVGGRSSFASLETVNVDDYGANGDGSTDATQAFKKAWKVVCSSQGRVVLEVPKNNNYLLNSITFEGPCKSNITVKIHGTVQAPVDRSDYGNDMNRWLLFKDVDNLSVQGGGIINGNGKTWWQNSCKVDRALDCTDAPTALTFHNCKTLVVKKLRIKDAQKMHVSFERCTDVEVSGLNITAPGNSPNTDGIHVTHTQDIRISNLIIATGDDCISIVSGSRKVRATGITCGPGHGISVGSLGARSSEAHVSDVRVIGATLSGTTNGVRIKTWQGGSGSASDIQFRNIEMHNVHNPIIINQNYCDQRKPCKLQEQAVRVQNVVYQNIRGTSSTKEAIKFVCSHKFPCREIMLQGIDLRGEEGKAAGAECDNAQITQEGYVSPSCT